MRANPQLLSGRQQALGAVLPAGGLRHDVCARSRTTRVPQGARHRPDGLRLSRVPDHDRHFAPGLPRRARYRQSEIPRWPRALAATSTRRCEAAKAKGGVSGQPAKRSASAAAVALTFARLFSACQAERNSRDQPTCAGLVGEPRRSFALRCGHSVRPFRLVVLHRRGALSPGTAAPPFGISMIGATVGARTAPFPASRRQATNSPSRARTAPSRARCSFGPGTR